jgi:uncharacterized lipoprotein
VKKLGFWMMSVLYITACSTKYASNDQQQYLKSHNGPQLETPAPLTHENVSGFYDLPAPEGAKKISVIPPQI